MPDPTRDTETMRPGDIWRHPGMGRLYVTDEPVSGHPEWLRCYWSMGGYPQGLATSWHPANTKGLELVSREATNA